MTNYLNHENKLPFSGILQVQVQTFQQRQSALGHHGNQCVSPGTLCSVGIVRSPFILVGNKNESRFVLPCPLRKCLASPRVERMLVFMPGKVRMEVAAQIGSSAFSPSAEAAFYWHSGRGLAGCVCWLLLFHICHFTLI